MNQTQNNSNKILIIGSVIAYSIVFYTLYNISIILFCAILFLFITNKILNMEIICKYFGCNPGRVKNGILYCKRCGKPLTRKLN